MKDTYTAWDDFKFSLAGLFLLALPLVFVGLFGLFIASFI